MASGNNIDADKSSENVLPLSMEMSFDERLTNFVRHFVVELESTLQLHYDILEGNINKSGQIPKFIGIALGLLANNYIHKGADKVVKLFQIPLKKSFEVIEKNKSLGYYDIVYSFHTSKEKGRKVFADIAIDVFSSFEFQFAGITSTRGDQKAIQRLARDAAQRFLNRFKSEGESYSNSTIVRKFQKGWRKIKKSTKPQLPATKVNYKINALRVIEGNSMSKSALIPDQVWKPGFDVSFQCRKSHVNCKNKINDWNTCDLFEKVGVAKKRTDSDDYDVYITNKSNCLKYGYRLPFPGENVNEYILTEKCECICMHPQIFKSQDFYESKREIVLKFINDNDQVAVQRRILKLTEEMKTDFAQFKDTLEIENRQLLITIETFNSHLMEIISRHYNYIQQHLITAEEHRNVIATENKKLLLETIDKTDSIISKLEDLEQNNAQGTVGTNKRILFRVKNPAISFEGRIKELELLHEALMNKTTAVISQTASIVGLGGIGKTELAKKYMEKYKNYYHNILFINAEKSETMLESFRMLASEIGINLTSNDGKERNITDVIKNIYVNLIKSGNTLVVFDNAEEYKDIKKIIFENSSYYENHVLCTLITSRSTKWNIGEKGDIKVIQLDIFTKDEALNYLRKSLENEDEDDLKSLMTLLQRFPLGLKQAVGYIKQQNEKANIKRNRNTFKVQNYINLFDDKWIEVLDKGHCEVDDLYETTIATTWRVTMQKIEERGECGKLALSVLKIMAYLAPDDIDIEKIFSNLEEDIDKLYEAVDLLHGYSMINCEKGKVSVHRLVQKAIQIYLIEIKDEENVLSETLKLLEGCNFKEHTISVWEHSSNYPEIVKNNYYNFKPGTPIELFIMHRNDTITIAKLLKYVECDLNTAIHFACQYGNCEVFKFLIENGADPNYKIENGADPNYKNKRNVTSLHYAAKGGSVSIMKLLIDKGLDVNMSDDDGEIPLFCAALYKRTEAFKLLLKSEANPNAINSRGETVLHHLVRYGAVEEFKLLLNEGADPNIRDRNDRSPLHHAAMFGSVGIVQLLIDKGLDVNMSNKCGEPPLLCAAMYFRTKVIQLLLKTGANPNAKNAKGETILHHLARNDAVEEFKVLLSEGVDPNIRDKNDRSPLHQAAMCGNVNIMKLLIDKGLDVNMSDKDGEMPLFCAALYKKTEAFKFLLKSKADPNAINSRGETILHHLVRYGAVEEFKLLLSEGADPNIRDRNDRSPLHHAAMRGSVSILQLLLDKELDVNMSDKYGDTPLICAAGDNRTEALKLLLKSGANPNAINSRGETVLNHLARNGAVEEFKLLLNEGADPNILDKNDRSPLHWAALNNSVSILQLLVDKGLDVNIIDKCGDTPLLSAASSGKFEAIKCLLENGADPKIVSKLGETLIHKAAYVCNLDGLKFIMELGFDLTVVDKLGNSPLHSAVHGTNKDIIEFLVEKGIHPNSTDKFGCTPLHDISYICWNITPDIVKLLLKLGANPNATSKSNCTPLHFASTGNNRVAATVLIEEGAEINIRNKLGRSALHYASSKCHCKIIELLLINDAEVNVFDSKGRTPLHHLSRNGKFKDVKLLLKHGADPRNLDKAGHSLLHLAALHFRYQAVDYVIKKVEGIDVNGRDIEGKTPLHLAAECGRVSIVGLLVRNGGDISATDKNGNTPLDLATNFNRIKVMDSLRATRYLTSVNC
ncbi:uncharacterized protein LOC143918938 [Arctopsyche grandis]|uniref:uncharacterized protein LOC143918938 n=1 Tax=Arctopsyche grandis TaxID=121162 RepID=UPI00406D9C67